MRPMKTISLTERSRAKLLHVEAPGCIINIEIDHHDDQGRPVVLVSVAADGNRYAGGPEWWIDGKPGNAGGGFRIVRTAASPNGRIERN